MPFATDATGRVGDYMVPIPHFGVLLGMAEWRALADRLSTDAVDFVIAPTIRFAGEPRGQATMFFRDRRAIRSK